jgi:response regulator RpfG family c-di-GMP phosphodiesterase
MARLDSNTLKKVTVHIGEKNYYERQQLKDMFIAQGIKGVVCHSSIDALRKVLLDTPPDLLILSDDFDPSIFEAVKEIRHQKLGENPFMLITVLVNPNRRDSLTLAIKAGVDDIVIKPVTPDKIRERLGLVAFHRPPFVSYGEYVGPERRSEQQPARVKRIPVLNTLLEKVNGRDFDKESLKDAITKSLDKVLQAQLDSQSSQLGELCERLVHAYDGNRVTPEVQDDLLTLSGVLQEASLVAARLRDTQLVAICRSLSDNIVKLADHYDTPSTKEIDLLRKVTAAFQMAMGAGAGPSEGAAEDPAASDTPDLSNYAVSTP